MTGPVLWPDKMSSSTLLDWVASAFQLVLDNVHSNFELCFTKGGYTVKTEALCHVSLLGNICSTVQSQRNQQYKLWWKSSFVCNNQYTELTCKGQCTCTVTAVISEEIWNFIINIKGQKCTHWGKLLQVLDQRHRICTLYYKLRHKTSLTFMHEFVLLCKTNCIISTKGSLWSCSSDT